LLATALSLGIVIVQSIHIIVKQIEEKLLNKERIHSIPT
jgi:hypothetical protein